ncbi:MULTISPECIES: cellulose biosynthesis protein BcsG [Serratia]|jgi:cellulose synthase operon protein YhjU|uniref:Cellulose biosynthesis protein BcsG n=2 Tax=Serratia bockelmannii TaxID=2703793 RepID=A0ABT8LR18_9GAMM|nr:MULTISPECIES: cellulose biosynthesis protein BcsG [Serratia]MBH3172727.1 cellulose biosynthesis protein BcsG [Serratia marcescens]MBK5574913.1 cellulose biosynthesis protein BcsG [Serratia marcescens]MDN6879756.1 cellulose biosynthesis protein BcsG [Serratia bockelmannii]QIR66711.1 cellulose biosynthesis protein BcsG [Serratia marcescens]UMK57579.1 cellulose biosynthesis protein BcsG [Serratia marcescens]
MNRNSNTQSDNALWRYWRGLGGWNLYFLAKFALLWFGYLNFHALPNLVFMAFLLMPIPSQRLHRWRHYLAIPIGIALFYHDTWLPGINSILSQGSQLAGFSAQYLLELVNRFINWQMIGAAFVLFIAYLFVAQWVRVTVFTVAALVWLNIVNIAGPAVSLLPATSTASAGSANTPATAAPAAGDAAPPDSLPPTSANLTAYLNQFYDREKGRATAFPTTLPADAQPFDLLVINICSLAWADMDAVNLQNHPLWSKMDIMFDSFNSATAYSGPASIRLLRASCGQLSHHDLYQPVNQQCYLFDNLTKLGFKEQLMLDHSGVFGNYLKELREQGDMQAPLMSQAGIGNELTSFDGEPIYNDLELLTRWLDQQQKGGDGRTATFFNVIPLHDGNRFVGANKSADYQPRAQKLFDQLNTFLDQLEKSGRKVVVVIVPEHGAALVGDKMQMSGLRDIPSPNITHTPVGIKLVGMKAPHQGSPLQIKTPSSYLALSELVSRLVDGKVFSESSVDWQTLTQGLPQTPLISENDNAIVMQYQGKPYIRLNGGDWVPYPQ